MSRGKKNKIKKESVKKKILNLAAHLNFLVGQPRPSKVTFDGIFC